MTVPTINAPAPACAACSDSGFIVVKRGIYTGAEPCACKGKPHWYRFRPKPRFSSTRYSRGYQSTPKKPWLYFQWTGSAAEAQRFAQQYTVKTGIEFEVISLEKPSLGPICAKHGSVEFYMENL